MMSHELKHHGKHQRSQTKLYRIKKEWKSLCDVKLYLASEAHSTKRCLSVCYLLCVLSLAFVIGSKTQLQNCLNKFDCTSVASVVPLLIHVEKKQ